MEKMMAINGPSQKFGIEMPTSDRVIAAKSIQVPRQTAATIPSGKANSMATAAANAVAVAGIRSRIRLATGWSFLSDTPSRHAPRR